MQYLDAISKMTEWSLRFQGKPFNITVIQVYAPTSNTEEAGLKLNIQKTKIMASGPLT